MYHLSVKVVSTLRTRNATLANLKNAVNYVSPPTPVHLTGVEVNLASPGGNSFWEGRFTPSPPIQSCGANVDVVDRPTQLICISDIYLLSTNTNTKDRAGQAGNVYVHCSAVTRATRVIKIIIDIIDTTILVENYSDFLYALAYLWKEGNPP